MTRTVAWALAVGFVVGLSATAVEPAHAARAHAADDATLAASGSSRTAAVSMLRPARLSAPRVAVADRDRDGAVTPAEAGAYYRARFAVLDADGDGALSEDEFVGGDPAQPPAVAAAVDPLRRERAPDFAALDLDGDNRISAEEFLIGRLYVRAGGIDPDERRQRRAALFAALDRDGDGVVSRDEFMAAGARHFTRRDANGDGKVSIWEFRSGPAF